MILILIRTNTYQNYSCVDTVLQIQLSLINSGESNSIEKKQDERFCFNYLPSSFETIRSSSLLFSPHDSLLFYVAKTAGFRLRSFSYQAYVNLHAQLSRLRRDCVNFVSGTYDRTDFTMPNALSIFSDLFVRYDLNHWVVEVVRPMFVNFCSSRG